MTSSGRRFWWTDEIRRKRERRERKKGREEEERKRRAQALGEVRVLFALCKCQVVWRDALTVAIGGVDIKYVLTRLDGGADL